MKIFVQIASYRDPQLIPTIKDMLANAKKPNNLVIGIARQYSDEDGFDNLDEYKDDKRFRILDIPYQDAKGVCWARHQVQQLYKGETYTLQIDSHIDRFIPEGAVFFLPETIPGWKEMKKPVTARFYSAHFCFTLGQFSTEVQHNPEYYFHGEEISIAARAYTWGYDLFHTHIPVVYHEYTRKGRTKQWDDDKTWGQKNTHSHLTNRKLFGMDGEAQEGHDGPYGFGPVRTLTEYEKYAGILFSKRAIDKHTLDKNYPPNPYNFETEQEWKDSFCMMFKHCIDIGYSQVTETDYDFWVVAFHNDKDETLFRKDADKNEIAGFMIDPDKYCKVWREFQTDEMPSHWVVWPHSESKGWCDRLTGQLTHNTVS